MALFTARAQAVEPAFEADDLVGAICRRLDELPLAIELAAARVKALPTAELLRRLERRLPLLTGGARDLPERQRTLRATIGWSYDLLAPAEQRLFARLAVFRGGCTSAAAETVAGAALDTLASLVDKSLLRHTGGRYWMLETVREYASEQLDQSGRRDELHRRMAEFLLSYVERDLTRPDVMQLAPLLREELENFREAVTHAIAAGDTTLVLRLATRAPLFGVGIREETSWLDCALTRVDEVSERLRVLAFTRRSAVAFMGGDLATADDYGQRSLEGYRRLRQPAEESRALRRPRRRRVRSRRP